ncbi:MAG TPA: NAD(P)-dependent oxidoreductase [Bryobacteraceae bacterium]|nr:NAD(P)-dependent oxidoreductase [Bryobacteraceae bacterium]
MTESEWEDAQSKPSDADCSAMRSLQGDVLVLGAGGKMGPSLARLARRASDAAGSPRRILAASRFPDENLKRQMASQKIEAISCDLLDREQLALLPDCPNVLFLAGRKFGSTGNLALTWATNVVLPAMAAERFRGSRIVALSSGNVYALSADPATEQTTPAPVGEYAQSVLARERVLEYFSVRDQTPVALLRLNYANDLRYGVLLDIGQRVWHRQAMPLATGWVNVIWQRDANSIVLRSLALAESPPLVLNVTGPERLSVRWIATRFGEIFGIEPRFEGVEAETALLSDASLCCKLLGTPSVGPEEMIAMTADWIRAGGATLDKPTRFEVRDGAF